MSGAITAARAATQADVPIIADLVRRAYEMYLPRMDRIPAPMTDDYAMLTADGVVTVLTVDSSVRGVLVGWVDGDSFYIDNVAVDPDAHGMGLGTALLALADEKATGEGCRRIWLYTNAVMTENLDYYVRRGFTQFDRRQHEGYDRVFFERSIP